jgi:hypothetical protein
MALLHVVLNVAKYQNCHAIPPGLDAADVRIDDDEAA